MTALLAKQVDLTQVASFVENAGYLLDGRPHLYGSPLPPRAYDAASGDGPAIDALAWALYENRYVNPAPYHSRPGECLEKRLRAEFTNALEAGNHGTGTLSSGWTIVGPRGDKLEIEHQDGRKILVYPKEFDNGTIIGPKGSREVQAGWYYAISNAPMPAMSKTPMVRLYWSISAQGAIPLMKAVTRILNEAGQPFAMKFLQEPQAYVRSDSAVLYIPDTAWMASRHAVKSVYGQIRQYLRRRQPRFTLELAPGLGLAEDQNAQSFGMTVSRLAAKSLWQHREQPSHIVPQLVYDDFAQTIDMQYPWRRKGSMATYTLEA
ncbi:MAG: T3SS effector HopA1 family protein [Thermoplasmatota archaeon]